MTKKEILKNYTINKLDNNTIFIRNNHFNFSYTIADSVVKEEYIGQYKYFGGLQCNYQHGGNEFKDLERWLCDIADKLLK